MPIRVQCPGCKKEFNAPGKYTGRSAKCPGCGAPIKIPTAEPELPEATARTWNPLLAVFLCFFFPGAAQAYKGQIGRAAAVFVLTIIVGCVSVALVLTRSELLAFCLFLGWLFLVVYDAYKTEPKSKYPTALKKPRTSPSTKPTRR